MQYNDFIYEMDRLSERFKGIIESESMLSRYWLPVQNLSTNEFTSIVNYFLDYFDKKPLPKDFAEAARPYKKNKLEHEKPDIIFCKQCFDTGAMVVADNLGNRYFAGCVCESSHKQPRLLKFDKSWSDHRPDDFNSMHWVPGSNKGKENLIEEWTSMMRRSIEHWKHFEEVPF